MSAQPSAPTSSARDLALRLADSGLVIAIVVAALYFAGWTYRQAYYLRFGLDPLSLTNSNVALAVEGLGAIVTTTAAWLPAILSLLLLSAIGTVVAHRLDRRRRHGHGTPFFNELAVFMVRIVASAIVILIIMAAGEVAGTMNAKDRVANVRSGNVWKYHISGETVPGVMIAQSNNATWVLTHKGVRRLKTGDISLIDGPLFITVVNDR